MESASRPTDGRDGIRGADQRLIDLVPLPVLLVESDGAGTWVNRAWTQLTGQSEHDSRGQGWLDIFDVADREVRRRELLAAVRPGSTHRMEWTVSANGHGRRRLEVQAVPEFESGQVARIVVTATDVTDVTDDRAHIARLLEQATHDSLTGLYNRPQFFEFLRHALDRRRPADAGVTAVLFVDVDGLKATNDEFGHAEGDRVLRQIADRIKSGVRPADVVARYGGDEFTVLCEHLDDATQADAIAHRIRSAVNGDPRRAVSIGVAIARGPDTDPVGIIARADQAMYDARRGNGHAHAGHRRESSRPRIGRASKPRAVTQHDDRLEAQTHEGFRLIAVAAHELRTPLTAIAGFASTLRADCGRMDAADVESALEIIDRQARRLAAMLDQLLELGQCHGGRPALSAVDLADVVTDALEAAPPPRHVSLKLSGPPTTPLIASAERSRVTRALVNLLTNAYRYGGPNVTIDSHNGAKDVTVSVQDDGPGVPGPLGESMFSAFVRGGIGGTSPPGGAGLGLTLARDIAESFGGHLTHEPVQPHGARFLLRLPAVTSRSGAQESL